MGICAVQRHLIQPGDQKIGVVDRNAACRTDLGIDSGVILRQQINDVEVIQVTHKAGQKVRTRNEQHIRQRDLGVLLEGVCTVNTRGFVKILRNIHQNTRCHEHDIGNTDPDIDHDQQHFGNDRGRPERNEVVRIQVIGNKGDVGKQFTDDTCRVKQLCHIQKGNELRNCNGHNQDRSPELLDLDAFFVDHDRHKHAKEVVGEGGKHRPHQGPGKDLTECKTHTAVTEIQKLVKVFKTYPGEQIGISVMCGIIAGKCDKHHENDGKHRESQNTDKGKRQHGLMELVVKQRLEVLLARFYLLALCGNVHANTALLDLQSPGVEECNDEDDGQKTIEQYLDRVVTGDPDGSIQ